MNDSLSGRPETLAAFGAGVRLGTRVDSFVNILFAGFPERFRTEAAFERFGVLMHPTVPLVATSATQHFAADGTFEHFIGNPFGRFSFELCQAVLQLLVRCL